MVRDAHLAEDITQGVFVALAKSAHQLADRPVLSGWLHRTAQNLAANAVRTEVRRRVREHEAAAMNQLLSAESEISWDAIAPHLDAALSELNEADHDALLLRYFEKKSAPEMAGILGISEDAAQKRVSRAVERLREFFSKRNITIGASGLVVLISANAVQSAPVGLAAAISAAAVLVGTAIQTSTVIAATKTIAMTTLQKSLVTATVAVLAGAGIYEARQASQLHNQLQTLQQQQAPLNAQIRQLQRERDDATNRLADLLAENARLQANQSETELLRLRAEVTRLTAMTATNASNSSIPSKKQQEINALLKQIQNQEEKANSSYEVEGRLLVLKQRLQLTPEQEAKLRNILTQKRAANERLSYESQTLDPDIAAILTPEQKLAAERLTQEEWQNTRDAQVSGAAEGDLRGLQYFLGLNEQQQAEALPVLEDYSAKMFQLQDAQKESGPPHPFSGVEPHSRELTDQKLGALKKILSPEQFEIYKSREESALEAQRLSNLMNQLNSEE